MADNVQINYTHKLLDHYDPHVRIQGVAGDGGNGWYRTTDQVLDDLRTGLNSYYVNVGGTATRVVRAVHEGHPYIKTETDDYAPNNLLALPEPPARLRP